MAQFIEQEEDASQLKFPKGKNIVPYSFITLNKYIIEDTFSILINIWNRKKYHLR